MSGLLRITDWVLSPLLAVGSLFEDFILPDKDRAKRKLFVAREDFKYFARQSEQSGALTPIESQLIENVVDYRACSAMDVMKPLGSVQLVRANMPIDELLELSKRTKLERFPAVSESDQIIGLLEVFDVLLDRTPRASASLHLRRILSVKAGEPAYTVMRKLRAARVSLACVVDTDSKIIGIVSGEDLIKSLVKPASA